MCMELIWFIGYEGVRISQNRGHQRTYCSSPKLYVNVESHGDDSDDSWE
jgi:hypothetical protein